MSVRTRILATPPNTWLTARDLPGSTAAVEQALSRAVKDESCGLVRAARGLYYMAETDAFGATVGVPDVVETALRIAPGRGVGPASLYAAGHLGLIDIPLIPHLTVLGSAPTAISNSLVVWEVRKNPARVNLNFDEQACLELLCLTPQDLDVPWNTMVAVVDDLVHTGRVSLDNITSVADTERRKPHLNERLDSILG